MAHGQSHFANRLLDLACDLPLSFVPRPCASPLRPDSSPRRPRRGPAVVAPWNRYQRALDGLLYEKVG